MSAPLLNTDTAQGEIQQAPGRERLSEMASIISTLVGSPEDLDLREANQALEALGTLGAQGLGLYRSREGEFLEELKAAIPEFYGPVAKLPMEESVYKQWTSDPAHPLSGKTGYTFGDPAQHMEELLARYGMEIDPRLERAPDHLVYLLEFLSLFLETRPANEVKAFCHDHLDWICALLDKARDRGASRVLIRLLITTEKLIEHCLDLESGEKIND